MEIQELRPILKWAGGKRQLLPEIRKHYPKEFNTYFEPFVGAGAVLFDLQPKKAIVNDINEELINIYLTMKNIEKVNKLVEYLSQYTNDKDTFYYLRYLDRLPFYNDLDPIIRASRILYLNKTCYNGLYRVNKKGQFNVPFGKYEKPNIVNEEGLFALHDYLRNPNINFLNTDFNTALEGTNEGDFIYLDPPYDPISESSSFTNYSDDGFTKNDQLRLYEKFCELNKKGCKVLLSNSATDFIIDLYKDFIIEYPLASRSINSKSSGRGKIKEVLVRNYE